LSVLGDDQTVLDVHAQAEQEGFQLTDTRLARLHHMAGVAAYRLGDEARARALWARALKAEPSFALTRQCIDDLNQPPGERNGPWATWTESFIPYTLLLDLQRRCESASIAGRNSVVQAELERVLRDHPFLITTVPLLLDHGDPTGRELALRLAGTARTPEMLAALHDFALGQRGKEAQRLGAAFSLVGTGLLPSGEVRLWRGGDWRLVKLPAFEVTREALGQAPFSPRAKKLYREGLEAMEAHQPERAEGLFRQALLEHPGERTLRFNLASVLEMQGRQEEAEDIYGELARQHPDYLHAVSHVARRQIKDGDLDQAEAMMTPFLDRPRFHAGDVNILAVVYVELARARKQPELAWYWIDLLEAVDPDNVNLPPLRTLAGPRPHSAADAPSLSGTGTGAGSSL
jgi:tetratricopeptide (TPR) repeat protein